MDLCCVIQNCKINLYPFKPFTYEPFRITCHRQKLRASLYTVPLTVPPVCNWLMLCSGNENNKNKIFDEKQQKIPKKYVDNHKVEFFILNLRHSTVI